MWIFLGKIRKAKDGIFTLKHGYRIHRDAQRLDKTRLGIGGKMDLSSQIVPSVITLIANLLSGEHGSSRWETVTSIFGLTATLSFIGLIIVQVIVPNNTIKNYLIQVSWFSLLTALSRDYERILHPLFPWNKK